MTEEIRYIANLQRQEEFDNEVTELKDELKRLEQDIKQLTQWLDEARRNADFWCDKCTNLEQENNEIKKQIESQKGLITVGGKQQYQYLQKIDELEQENEIIAKQYNSLLKQYNSLMAYTKELEAKINEQQSSNIR